MKRTFFFVCIGLFLCFMRAIFLLYFALDSKMFLGHAIAKLRNYYPGPTATEASLFWIGTCNRGVAKGIGGIGC